MNKLVIYLLVMAAVACANRGRAQTFAPLHDTVRTVINGNSAATDTIVVTGAGTLDIKYHAIASDFPASWLPDTVFGVIDPCNGHVNLNGVIWDMTTSSGSYFNCNGYTGSNGTLAINLNLAHAPMGCHYITFALTDVVVPSVSKNITFITCKNALAGVQATVPTRQYDVRMYPNPADNELNIVYDPSLDVRSVAVYNIIGKVTNVYKVTGSSANLNIGNLQQGIYFVKLYDDAGNAVVTRKFIKQ